MDDYELKDNGWVKGTMMSLLPSISQHKWTCGWCNGWIVRESSTGPPLRSDHHESCRYYLPAAAHDIPSPHEVVEIHSAETIRLKEQIKRLQAVVKAVKEYPTNEQLDHYFGKRDASGRRPRVYCDEEAYDVFTTQYLPELLATLQDGDLE